MHSYLGMPHELWLATRTNGIDEFAEQLLEHVRQHLYVQF